MLTEYLLNLILDMLNMPAEVSAGILALYQNGLFDIIMSVAAVCVTMLCIGVKRSFFEQAGLALMREPVSVTAGGILWYGLGIALMLIFFISVVGFPVAVLVFFVIFVLIFIGQAALSVMFGEIFADKFNRVLGNYQAALVGALIIELFDYLPYVGWLFRFLIWPVLALGVLSAGISNGYVKNIFYPPLRVQNLPPGREGIRDIILKQTR